MSCDLCPHPQCSGAHTVASIADFALVSAELLAGWSQGSIALEHGLSKGYVGAIAKGWPLAPLCEFCGVAFFPKRTGTRRQRFDRAECQYAYARGEKPEEPAD